MAASWSGCLGFWVVADIYKMQTCIYNIYMLDVFWCAGVRLRDT